MMEKGRKRRIVTFIELIFLTALLLWFFSYKGKGTPQDYGYYFYYSGKSLAQKNHYGLAGLFLRTAVRIYPDLGNAYLMLGFLHTRQGRFALAEQDYTAALRHSLTPINRHITCNNLGSIYLEDMDRFEDAARAFEQSIQSAPGLIDPDVDPHNGLARAYAALGEYDKAEAAAQESIRLHPRRVGGCYNLAQVYLCQNDLPAAQAMHDKLASFNPGKAAELQNLFDHLARTQKEKAEFLKRHAGELAGEGKSADAAVRYLDAVYRLEAMPAGDFREFYVRQANTVIREGWNGKPAFLATLVEKNRDPIRRFKQAAAVADCDFSRIGLGYKDETAPVFPAASFLEPARLCLVRGRMREHEGKLDEALDDYQSVLRFARHFDRQGRDILMMHMMENIILNFLYPPLWDLMHSPQSGARLCRALLAALLSVEKDRADFAPVFAEEGEFVKRNARQMNAAQDQAGVPRQDFSEQVLREVDTQVDALAAVAVRAFRANRPELYTAALQRVNSGVRSMALKNLARGLFRLPSAGTSPKDLARIVCSVGMPPLSQHITRYYLMQARWNVFLAAAALRAYEAEHGTMPDTLPALVPAYLPYVPRDPFHKFQPMKLLKRAQSRVAYSIGPDRRDDSCRRQYDFSATMKFYQPGDIFFGDVPPGDTLPKDGDGDVPPGDTLQNQP